MNNQNSQLDRLRHMQADQTEFKRELGLFSGVNVLAGIMVGSGIFYLGSYVLMRSGMSLGLALLCWVIGGLVTLLSGLCYAELGAMLPRAGGSYVYLREAFSPVIAFMSGFSGLLLGSSGSIAGLAVAFAAMVNNILPGSPLNLWQQKLVAVAGIILLTLVNLRGIKMGALVQNIFTVAKLVPIVIILGVGLFAGTQAPDLSLIPASNPSPMALLQMVALGVVATLWAYEGWTNLNTVSEEMRNPKKNLPLAIVLSIVAVMVLYVLFNFAVYRVLPFDFISSQLSGGQLYLGTETAKALLGERGMTLVSLGMLISVFGALNGCVMVFPRSYYAMANDGAMFTSFKKLHPEYKTPVNALLTSMVLSIILVMMRNLDQLTNLVVFSGMIYKTLTFCAVIRLRQKYPSLDRPYKVVGYPHMVYLTVAVMVALMANTLYNDPSTSLIGLSVSLVGFILYQISQRSKSRSTDQAYAPAD